MSFIYKEPQSMTDFSALESKCVCEYLIAMAFDSRTSSDVKNEIYLYFSHDDEDIVRSAMVAIGHLARLHHDITRDEFLFHLSNVNNINKFSGVIDDVLDDIQMFSK